MRATTNAATAMAPPARQTVPLPATGPGDECHQHAFSGRATPKCTTTSVLDPPAKLYYSWGAANVAHTPVGLHERGPQPPSPPPALPRTKQRLPTAAQRLLRCPHHKATSSTVSPLPLPE